MGLDHNRKKDQLAVVCWPNRGVGCTVLITCWEKRENLIGDGLRIKREGLVKLPLITTKIMAIIEQQWQLCSFLPQTITPEVFPNPVSINKLAKSQIPTSMELSHSCFLFSFFFFFSIPGFHFYWSDCWQTLVVLSHFLPHSSFQTSHLIHQENLLPRLRKYLYNLTIFYLLPQIALGKATMICRLDFRNSLLPDLPARVSPCFSSCPYHAHKWPGQS